MKCLESEWWVYFWVAFVCFWIYVVGIPVVLLIVLWKRKYSPAGKFNKKNDKRLISNTKGLGWLVCKCVPKRIASYFEPDPEHDLDHIHTKRQFGPLYLNYEPEYCPSRFRRGLFSIERPAFHSYGLDFHSRVLLCRSMTGTTSSATWGSWASAGPRRWP